MRSCTHLRILLLAVLIALSAPVLLQAQNLKASGRVILTYYMKDGGKSYNSNVFTVWLHGCDIRIRTQATGDRGILWNEYGSLGTNSWFYIKFTDELLTSAFRVGPDGQAVDVPFKTPRKAENDSLIEVRPSLVPPQKGLVTPIWLAFGSGCYLRSLNKDRITPLFFMGDQRLQPRITTRAIWTLSDTPPGFAEFITDFRDSAISRLPVRFPAETTNSTFRVTAWTNLGQLKVPIECNVVRYEPDLDASSGSKLRIESEMFCVVTNISTETSEIAFAPPLSERTSVIDYRFSTALGRSEPVSYLAKELQIHDLERIKELSVHSSKHPPSRTAVFWRSARQWALYACLGFFLIAPILFFATGFLRKKHTNEQSQ